MRRSPFSVVVAAVTTLATLVAVGLRPDRSAAAASVRYPSIAFRVECSPSHQSNDDPLVHPGHAGASHRHQFFGNRSTSETSTTASLRLNTTTCDDAMDRSAYWAPTPIGATWVRLRAYYDRGGVDAGSIVTPPPWLAGITRSGSGRTDAEAVWSCGRSVDADGWEPSPPVCPTGSTLRVRVTFGQCITGERPSTGPVELVQPTLGRCPASQPVAVPRLRLVLDASGPIRSLSVGPLSTMHADFMNGWDPDRLDELVRRCIRGERLRGNDTRLCRPL